MSLNARIENEIVELHQFFQDWFNGELAPVDQNFSRLDNVLDPNFTMVTPGGSFIERESLVRNLRAAHDSRQNMRIWIENVNVVHQFGEIAIAAYEEWQEIGAQVTSRLSSATFKSAPKTPHGIRWLHVHETWTAPQD